MTRILLPGWGMPIELYASLRPDIVFDYGFFGETAKLAESDCSWRIRTARSMDVSNGEFAPPDDSYELLAHSMGALFALADSPLRNNAANIVVWGGFAKFTASDDNPNGISEDVLKEMMDDIGRSPTATLKKFHRLVAFPERFRIPPPSPDSIDKTALRKGLEILRKRDVRGDLKSLSIQTLFIHGEKDSVASVELARKAAESAPSAQLKIIAGKGHAIPFTSPDAANE